jgi:hypothetical protein
LIDVLDSCPEAAVSFAASETQDDSGTWTEEMLREREVRVRKPPHRSGNGLQSEFAPLR